MTENIKNTAIPASGYIYQNRQGLRVLCDWLDAPNHYVKVKFECDDKADAPTALDDIVIERTDGLQDLIQVKFTPNPDAHALSWDWLLEKSGKTERSRSMLRKWFDAYRSLGPERIGELSLLTNRRPDAEIEACLVGGKIDFSKVANPRRAALITELGSDKNCKEFLGQLLIMHSDKGYETLEHEIDARLRAHGTPEGIAVLKNVALNWAVQKNSPPPSGWITLPDLRAILQATPPAPLPEDFAVPKGYEVPDAGFHAAFVDDTLHSAGKAIVLTGPPGRGKSTYLSALCDTLADKDIPTVRHHYFLSTTERGRDRIHSYIVEDSIRSQIERFHPDAPRPAGGLRALLEATAAHYKVLGKPFVLILDGLDHVWRINAEDKQPLDDLFAQLVPCPENLVLLVGTQSVDDAQLPADLLIAAPKASWKMLPVMSSDAVLSYLRQAVQAGRLSTGFEPSESDEPEVDEAHEGTAAHHTFAEDELQRAAATLRIRTNGHPLHIIYATSALVLAGGKVTRWDVEQLAGDLSQDVKFYYGSLWERLSPSLKDALRLMCAFPFFWPRTAFGEIAIAMKLAVPEIEKVEHLLHSSAAGLKVFHESLAVYVRSTDGYVDRIVGLRPEVARWLDISAPKALRVNWLWTLQAQLGDPSNLIAGLTRDWVLLRLEEGYPQSLFDTLITDAMAAALDRAEFGQAYRLQHLKARMVEGSRYQMQDEDMARLVSYTWALAPDDGVLREAVASRHETDIKLVAALGLALRARGDHIVAEICGEEALRRFRGASRFSSEYATGNGLDAFRFLADAFARLGAVGATQEELKGLVTRAHPEAWLPRVRLMAREGLVDDLMSLAASMVDGRRKCAVTDACLRAAAQANVSIVERPDFNTLPKTSFVAAMEAAHTRTVTTFSAAIPINWLGLDYRERKLGLARLVHHWFFSAVHLTVCMAVEGQTEFSFARAPVYADRENVTNFLNELSGVAAQVALHWWRGEFVDFHELYKLMESLEFRQFRQNHDWQSAAEDFRASLHRVACDVQLGSILLGHPLEAELTEMTVTAAGSFRWFDAASFCEQYVAGLLTKMSDEAALTFVRSQHKLFDAEVRQETSVHLQTPLQLCGIAVAHGLVEPARKLRRQTWELASGFSHRKDPTLNNTLDAIGYLAEVSPKEARRLLEQVASQVQSVLDYTDGSGTRHVLTKADALLVKLAPAALVAKYEEHLDAGEWAQAENCLGAYVEEGVKAGWPLDVLMRTGLHPEIGDVLQRLVKEGITGATERLQALNAHGGWDVGVLCREEHAGSSVDRKPFDVDVSAFEPEQLKALLDQLSDGCFDKDVALLAWYRHWEAKGQGKRLLEALEDSLLSGRGRGSDLLDLSSHAFHTRRKLSGPKAAWKYLVSAQINSGAWIGYMEREEKTFARLDLVAKHYPNRCDEFVIDTAYAMFGEPVRPRFAPGEAMVYFYVKQGRIDEAVAFAQAMVDCVLEDTRTLPLTAPRWGRELAEADAPGEMDDLRILIARLGWPTPAARWWSIQELATRLGDPATMGETESVLLKLLHSRKLEAEVVEVLCIFWTAASAHGYAPSAELPARTPKPSLLSNLFIEALGFAAQALDIDLKVAPKDFEIPVDFEGVQGVDLASIFRNTLSGLELRTKFPLIRQMAFEWAQNQTVYPESPLQGDFWHFARPLGNGFVGQYSARAALRAISAYLRTLVVAERLWGLPSDVVRHYSLTALPIHPTLAALRPSRPDWVPVQGDFSGSINPIEEILRDIVDRVAAERPGDELIAFSTPVEITMERCVEVSLVRWMQIGDSDVADPDLAVHLDSFWRDMPTLPSLPTKPLDSKTWLGAVTVDQLLDDPSASLPLAGRIDFNRMGYLQLNLYPSRLFVPTLHGAAQTEVRQVGTMLEVLKNEQVMADYVHWNAGWGPVRPGPLSGACGAALVSRGTTYREFLPAKGQVARSFYLWQVRMIHRSNTYDAFDENLQSGVFFV
ncbi:ATP-binding protein [Pseudomonas syringae]|uniref:ATP-binding protein n=2 Tax=Pseudomonas syringae group TaxID=136849 RepID=UPI00211E6F03|nr:ATP-binding protein [Pseudomonas syringae]